MTHHILLDPNVFSTGNKALDHNLITDFGMKHMDIQNVNVVVAMGWDYEKLKTPKKKIKPFDVLLKEGRVYKALQIPLVCGTPNFPISHSIAWSQTPDFIVGEVVGRIYIGNSFKKKLRSGGLNGSTRIIKRGNVMKIGNRILKMKYYNVVVPDHRFDHKEDGENIYDAIRAIPHKEWASLNGKKKYVAIQHYGRTPTGNQDMCIVMVASEGIK